MNRFPVDGCGDRGGREQYRVAPTAPPTDDITYLDRLIDEQLRVEPNPHKRLLRLLGVIK